MSIELKSANSTKSAPFRKKSLIIGISGQDGTFLADFLLKQGHEVHGSSRDAQASGFRNLKVLGILDRVHLHSLSPNDFRSVLSTIQKIRPDEIYNLSGQSSVGLSFEQPVETFESISVATINILESIRFLDYSVRFYNAGSSECYGETPESGADEINRFNPKSPYAIAKATSYWQIANYRDAYKIFACTGVLFNHESYFRADHFVTKKIIQGAIAISQGRAKKLVLGNLEIYRDWGWAPEYVEAMWMMLQRDQADDFIIATGQTHSLREFVQIAFQKLGLNWENHVEIDPTLFRPSDPKFIKGNPEKARKVLGWSARSGLEDIIRMMTDYELKK